MWPVREDAAEVTSGAGLLALMLRSQEPACVAGSFPLQAGFTIPVSKGVCAPFGKENISGLAELGLVCWCAVEDAKPHLVPTAPSFWALSSSPLAGCNWEFA